MLFVTNFIYEPEDMNSYVNIIKNEHFFMGNIFFEFGSKITLWLIGIISTDIPFAIFLICGALLYYSVHLDHSLFRKLCWIPLIGMYYGENFLFNQIRMTFGLPFFMLWYINENKSYSYVYLLISSFFHIIYIVPLFLYVASHGKIWLFSIVLILLSPYYFPILIEQASVIEKIYFYSVIEGSSEFILLRMALFISFVLVIKKLKTEVFENRLFRSYLIYFLVVLFLFDFLPVIFGRISTLVILSEPFIVSELSKQKAIYAFYLIFLTTFGVMRVWLQS